MISVLIEAVRIFSQFLWMLIFARIIMSWFPSLREGPLGGLLFALTEPIIGPVRKILQKTPLGGPGMVLDFAPLASFLLIRIAEMVIVSFLMNLL